MKERTLSLELLFLSARSPTGLATRESATRKTLASSKRRPTFMPWRQPWEPDRATIPHTHPTPQVPKDNESYNMQLLTLRQWNILLLPLFSASVCHPPQNPSIWAVHMNTMFNLRLKKLKMFGVSGIEEVHSKEIQLLLQQQCQFWCLFELVCCTISLL